IASGEEYTTGFKKWGDGYISAMSQPDGAMTWYPANNYPTDKATFTFRITVDDPNIVVASGTLQEVIPVDADTNTYVWEMSYPMATQVSAVTIGEYELEESVAPNGIPLRNYYPVGMDRSMFSALDKTGDMMVFLEDLLGPYPYDVYGAIIVPGYLPEGALEAQTLSVFDAYELDEEIVVHELSHQWFGNSLTVAEWTDIWLHEGFAKYFEALWLEKTRGVAAYNEAVEGYYEKQLADAALAHILNGMGMEIEALVRGQVMAVADPIAANMYWQSYTGGALLLHNLRLEVGDEIFFDIMRTFYQEHENIPATTEEFIATADELAGRDLSSVWDIWLYSNEIPEPEPLPESGQ
ncbi:MAG: M1 family metallopeptidase, partial [Kiritimatiellae bacterium]|nr:M1 family metallopeptidase [Kiritimatiellia bacterium]